MNLIQFQFQGDIMAQWYEKLFENYAETYEKEGFVQGTLGEVDFVESEIEHNKKLSVLDVGCGTGRHTIELSTRGYSVTGIDLSQNMLDKAKHKALESNVSPVFLKRDARYFSCDNQFNVAIMLCEGSFPLMETDEMNFVILKNIFLALKPGGKFIFTTLNGLYPLFHSVKDFVNSNPNVGISKANTFDLMTFRETSVYETKDDSGNSVKLNCNERYYIPSEITWLLKSLGFKDIEIFAARLGEFSRNHPLTTDDFEMLIVCEKPEKITKK